MVSTAQNNDVIQDAERALVVAVSCHAVFDPVMEDGGGVHRAGVAVPLLQALQTVNRCLLQENHKGALLFDVVLICTDAPQWQNQDKIRSSSRHHGLEVDRFCFVSQEDLVGALLEHGARLFVSSERGEVSRASRHGIFSALLDESAAAAPSDQLRVLFCADGAAAPSAGQAAETFLTRLGDLRRRFDLLNSPVCVGVLTSRGGRERCAAAIRTLRTYGVEADEAHCLAGAPRGPMLSLLRPHLLLGEAPGPPLQTRSETTAALGDAAF